MISNRIPALNRPLSIAPHQLQIVLAEDGRAKLTLLLPPVEEILEIRQLSSGNVSLIENAAETSARLANNFSEELKRLLEKRERFQSSPTYLAHLANLAEMSRDFVSENKFLSEAEVLTDAPFFKHRHAVNLISQGELEKAESVFRHLELTKDVGANLRLAYLYVRRQQFDRAGEFVEKAVGID